MATSITGATRGGHAADDQKQRPDGRTDAVGPTPRRLALLWGVLVLALAVHNLEEVLLDLPRWAADRPFLPSAALYGEQAQFGLAVLIVTGVVAVIGAIAIVRRPAWSAEVLACLAHVLLINAATHVVVSAVSWSLMPGLVTGVLLLLPIGLLVVRSLPPVQWTRANVLIVVGAAAGIVFGSLGLAALVHLG